MSFANANMNQKLIIGIGLMIGVMIYLRSTIKPKIK